MLKRYVQKWFGLAIVMLVGLLGLGTSKAQAQFGFSYNAPGLSIGVGQPAYYGGYYPVAPVVVPPPVIVPYGPRPYYAGGVYGYRGGYGPGPRGGYYGGPRGGYGYPHRPY